MKRHSLCATVALVLTMGTTLFAQGTLGTQSHGNEGCYVTLRGATHAATLAVWHRVPYLEAHATFEPDINQNRLAIDTLVSSVGCSIGDYYCFVDIATEQELSELINFNDDQKDTLFEMLDSITPTATASLEEFIEIMECEVGYVREAFVASEWEPGDGTKRRTLQQPQEPEIPDQEDCDKARADLKKALEKRRLDVAKSALLTHELEWLEGQAENASAALSDTHEALISLPPGSKKERTMELQVMRHFADRVADYEKRANEKRGELSNLDGQLATLYTKIANLQITILWCEELGL